QTRVGRDDLQLDVRWGRHHQWHVVPQGHDAHHAVLEPLRVLAHRRLAGGVLLEALRHHEMPEVPVMVEILHLGIDHVRGLQRFTGPEGPLDRAAGLEVAHLDAVERLALARLDELVLDHGVGLAVEEDFEASADLAGRVAGHLTLALAYLRFSAGMHKKGPRMIAASPAAGKRARRLPPRSASSNPSYWGTAPRAAGRSRAPPGCATGSRPGCRCCCWRRRSTRPTSRKRWRSARATSSRSPTPSGCRR